ncbi:hypothetical protein NM688_g894 [Phlebia brevispora]|uniref:Uncharacterized protein n=1 Tax=Phlebia brevispora TaxID=194682 RepID=A0ACC1TDB9_9APHY|nr:hypothetical protein NM688_g894 [Phlebia brevispora]
MAPERKPLLPAALPGSAVTLPPSGHGWKETAMAYFKLTRMHVLPAGADVGFWPGAWSLAMAAYLVAPWVTVRAAYGTITQQITSPRLWQIMSLVWCAGQEAFKLGLGGVFITLLYPLMKRWTYWPQAWLGMGMAWALPVAWVSNVGYRQFLPPAVTFAGCISWTLYYDTMYACQDRRDDIQAGIKSTAVLFGDYVRLMLGVFAVVFVACLAAAGTLMGYGIPYFLISVGGAAAHMAWQLVSIDLDNPKECWTGFKRNGIYTGLFIWIGMLAEYVKA